MNILYFEPSSGFGGSGNALFNLLNCINKNRFQPMVVTMKNGPQFEKIKNLGIKTIILATRKINLFDFLKIASLIKRYKINLVHINTNVISGIPSILAAKICRIPCLCHIRQTRRLIKRERFFARFVDKFIVLNQKAKEILMEHIPEEKICLIYDGVRLENYEIKFNDHDVRKEFSLNGQPCIGMISRLVKGKGCDDFIKVAAIIVKERPFVKFFIVGNDPTSDKRMESKLRALSDSLDLNNNFILTGWRDDIAEVISSFDIAVQPYTCPEGLPNAIIEAMALGKPVVTTDVPGTTDLVIEGKTGFVVQPGDVNALAERVLSLLDNPDYAERMGNIAKERVRELYDMQKTLDNIETVYKSLWSKKNV